MSEIDADVTPDPEPSSPESTGNGRIDEAIARLDRLDELPVDAHPDIFDEIHTGLRDALANAGRDEDPSAAS